MNIPSPFTQKIEGGAVLWARSTIESDIFYNKPDKWFKIWFFIVCNVSYHTHGIYEKGTGFFTYKDIMNSCKCTKDEVKHTLEYLKGISKSSFPRHNTTSKIATQKATRGLFISVLNYAKYQNFNNYKSHAKSHLKATQKPHCIQEGNKRKEEGGEELKLPTPAEQVKEFLENKEIQNISASKISETKKIDKNLVLEEINKFISYWTELTKSGKQQRWELEPTFEITHRLSIWFNNVQKFSNFKIYQNKSNAGRLNDGQRAFKIHGIWKDAEGRIIDPQYYPEVAKDNVMSEKEWDERDKTIIKIYE